MTIQREDEKLEKPILFSGPMVRAILEGRKTMTRRIIKGETRERTILASELQESYEIEGLLFGEPGHWIVTEKPIRYSPGMRLWVRETFRGAAGYDDLPPSKWGNKPIWFEADGEPDWKLWWFLSTKARPGIHLPRERARLLLDVTAVKVERLQDISSEDAKAEGIREFPCLGPHRGPAATFWTHGNGKSDEGASISDIGAFRNLWESINGPGSWEANPWIVAVSFTPLPQTARDKEMEK